MGGSEEGMGGRSTPAQSVKAEAAAVEIEFCADEAMRPVLGHEPGACKQGDVAGVVAAAKEMTGRAGRYVGQQAIQLHGGMGMTDELNVSHYFKRLTAIDVLFGNAASQRTRFATMKESGATAQMKPPRKSWVKI